MRELMLIIHFIGLAMALGTGFANLFLGIAASKLVLAEKGSFMSKTLILGRMGQIGLGLLLLSGFYLATPFWSVLGSMPLFISKLVLVSILVIVVIMISLVASNATKKGNPSLLAKIKPLGIITFLLGITIVMLAVLTFN